MQIKQNLQFQEREVGVAIICLVVALLLDVILEDGRRLWVVPVEPVEDRLDVLWALRRVVERDTHDVDDVGRGEVGGGRWRWRWS